MIHLTSSTAAAPTHPLPHHRYACPQSQRCEDRQSPPQSSLGHPVGKSPLQKSTARNRRVPPRSHLLPAIKLASSPHESRAGARDAHRWGGNHAAVPAGRPPGARGPRSSKRRSARTAHGGRSPFITSGLVENQNPNSTLGRRVDILVEPIPRDASRRADPSELDALALPPLLAAEDGIRRPADLAFGRH